MARDTSPVPMKPAKAVVIGQDIKEYNNAQLVKRLSIDVYDFCNDQDMADPSLEVVSDKMEQLMLESLTRIFDDTHIGPVDQFKIYEAIEKVFDSQAQYDLNKGISALRRIKLWDGIDTEDDNYPKYFKWFTNRLKRGSRVLCSKLELMSRHSVQANASQVEYKSVEDLDSV